MDLDSTPSDWYCIRFLAALSNSGPADCGISAAGIVLVSPCYEIWRRRWRRYQTDRGNRLLLWPERPRSYSSRRPLSCMYLCKGDKAKKRSTGNFFVHRFFCISWYFDDIKHNYQTRCRQIFGRPFLCKRRSCYANGCNEKALHPFYKG